MERKARDSLLPDLVIYWARDPCKESKEHPAPTISGKDIEAAIGQVVAEDEDAIVVVTVTGTVIVTAIATVTDVADRTDPEEVDLTEIENPHAQRAVSGDDVETETPVRLPLLKSNPMRRVIRILRVVAARRMKSDYSIIIQLYRYLMLVQL